MAFFNVSVVGTSRATNAYIWMMDGAGLYLEDASTFVLDNCSISAIAPGVGRSAHSLFFQKSALMISGDSSFIIRNTSITAQADTSAVALYCYFGTTTTVANNSAFAITDSSLEALAAQGVGTAVLSTRGSSLLVRSGSSFVIQYSKMNATTRNNELGELQRWWEDSNLTCGNESASTSGSDSWTMFGATHGLYVKMSHSSAPLVIGARCKLSVWGNTLPNDYTKWLTGPADVDAAALGRSRFQCNVNDDSHTLTLADYQSVDGFADLTGPQYVTACDACATGVQCHPTNTLGASAAGDPALGRMCECSCKDVSTVVANPYALELWTMSRECIPMLDVVRLLRRLDVAVNVSSYGANWWSIGGDGGERTATPTSSRSATLAPVTTRTVTAVVALSLSVTDEPRRSKTRTAAIAARTATLPEAPHVAISVTLSGTESPAGSNETNATAAPTPAPTPKPKPPSTGSAASKVIAEVLPTSAAQTIQGTGTSSTVLAAGVLGNPSSPSQAARAGYMLSLASCGLGELDDVSPWEHPLAFIKIPLGGGDGDGGDAATANEYASACLSTTFALTLLPAALVHVLWLSQRRRGGKKRRGRDSAEDADDGNAVPLIDVRGDGSTSSEQDAPTATTSTTTSTSSSGDDSTTTTTTTATSSSSTTSSSSSSSSPSPPPTASDTPHTHAKKRQRHHRRHDRSSLISMPLRLANIAEMLALIYFVPNVLNATLVVLSYSASTTSKVVACACCALGIGLVALRFHSAQMLFAKNVDVLKVSEARPGKTQKEVLEFKNATSAAEKKMYVERYYLFFDAARDPTRWLCRAYVFEEFVASATMAFVGGYRSSNLSFCRSAAFVILIVGAVHLAYACLVRPYRSKIDTFFLIAVALVQLCMAVCIVILQMQQDASGAAPEGGTVKVLGYLTITQFAAFFVQLVAAAFWAYTVSSRRKVLAQQQQQASIQQAAQAAARPLLLQVPVPAADAEASAPYNPLLQQLPQQQQP